MDQHAGEKLSEVIGRQVAKVEYYSSDISVSPDLAVHELRKSFKRIRAVLRFYRSAAGDSTGIISRKIRNFGRKLSPLRESWVNADLFETHLDGINAVSVKRLRKVGEALWWKNRDIVKKNFREKKVCGSIISYIAGMESRLEVSKSSDVTLKDIIEEISRNYLECSTRFEEMPADFPAGKLHSLRKQMKRLYYQLDFLWQLEPGCFNKKNEQLDLLNDQLGLDHDFYVLVQELESPDFGLTKEEIDGIEHYIFGLRAENLLNLLHRLKEFFTESPDEFDLKLEHLFF